MSLLLEYIFKLSASLSVVGLFYHFILRKHTFYNWNRWYLLGYSGLAFFIPFINVSKTIQDHELGESRLVTFVPAVTHLTSSVEIPAQNFSNTSFLTTEEWILVLIALGTAIMLIRFCFHFISYYKIKKSALLVSDNDVKIYHLDKNMVPFSFGNAIFINPDLHNENELKDIILHEFIHVKQRHTVDIIFGELLCILNWYNPVVWLIRFSIRQNLEYIADRQVLENGVNLKKYQYLLLKVVGVPEFRIANQFNFSSLKQRIIMMNKVKTSRVHLIRFLFILPLLMVLILACRNEIEDLTKDSNAYETGQNGSPSFSGYIVNGATGKPIEDFPLKLEINGKEVKTIKTDQKGFYFWEDEKWWERNSLTHYNLGYDGDKYKRFIMGSILADNRKNEGHSCIVFVSEKSDKNVRTDMYYVNHDKFYKSGYHRKDAISEFLSGKKDEFTEEYNLIASFRKVYDKPVNIITKFENGYFNQERQLVGYDSFTQFYLDGEKVDYQDINKSFKDREVTVLQVNQDPNHRFLNKEMFYLTYPTYKKAPPVYLLRNNIERVSVDKFDLSLLKDEAYFLDGFRQVYGIGSNMIPLKNEIKSVILFKGNLAKYYDQKLEKVWWIETRPESEVYERPDLAIK